jgi:hypothetical protein
MAKIVTVPSVGNVQFPDEMSDDEVLKAAAQLHQSQMRRSDQPLPAPGGLRQFAAGSANPRQTIRNVLARRPSK